MSGLSDFLTSDTAPWWTGIIGVAVGGVLSTWGTRTADRRRRRDVLASKIRTAANTFLVAASDVFDAVLRYSAVRFGSEDQRSKAFAGVNYGRVEQTFNDFLFIAPRSVASAAAAINVDVRDSAIRVGLWAMESSNRSELNLSEQDYFSEAQEYMRWIGEFNEGRAETFRAFQNAVPKIERHEALLK